MADGDSSSTPPRVIVVDDDRTQADMLGNVLALEGMDVTCRYSPAGALEEVQKRRPDIIVSDYRMPGMTGVELYSQVRASGPPVIFIIITAFGTLETAVEAMRTGIHDFITKPVNTDELLERMKKALHVRSLEQENLRLKQTVVSLRGDMHIVGASAEMQGVLETVEQVSESQATVLLNGESGTGKELVARAIHQASPRHAGPYVRVNCASIPENLLEAELFGYFKGAFTGAVADRKGKFEQAHEGTILLDEIADLPLLLQPKILRVLQEREVEPLGSDKVIPVDARVIVSTHRDLRAMVEEGTFREDLYYRLNVIPLYLPALRERGRDVEALANHFLQKFCDENSKRIGGFSPDAIARLQEYSWPGNVRELENCVERAVVLTSEDILTADDLMLAGPRREGAAEAAVDALFDTDLTLEDLERQILLSSLERCGGNLSRTARTLGMTRRSLQYRAEKIKGATTDPESDKEET